MIDNTPPPFDAAWFRLIVGLAVGVAIGSFVTMLSYRLPRRMSIVTPRSHCPACKTPLKPRELVPVVSWVIQRGQCRTCGVFTGWRYLLIEIVMGLATMLAFVVLGFTFLLLVPLALTMALVTAIVIWLER
jgi:prepilin signal peptidase PulO-like enzyme (type II secretory pathway)